MIGAESFLKSLNEKQREAVIQTEGPLLVLAGAGTGKTKVLTTRIVNIINQNLALPGEILAVTFTNKAAREMADRIRSQIDCEGLSVGTFHSIAAKILRSHIESLDFGISANFNIADREDQLKLIKDLGTALSVDLKLYPPKALLSVISKWKDSGLLPSKISPDDVKIPLKKAAYIIYREYQDRLIESNLVDFGDLLLYNNELFIKKPEILEFYRDRYKYILIDEYQDTNIVQYLWARMLAGVRKNICCVGDDDQSIYSWRGAEVGNILRFGKDFPNAKVIKLEQNYRSGGNILGAASSIIGNNENRTGKKLWTDSSEGEKVKIVSCYDGKEEARFVAGRIDRFLKEGKYSSGQIALLVRAGFQTRAFEEFFIKEAVPYKIIGGLKFYDRAEIKDLLAYIRICLNFGDNLALERIINVPKRALGPAALKQIKDRAYGKGISIFGAADELIEEGSIKNKAGEALSKLLRQIPEWKERYDKEDPVRVTKSLLEESGYIAALKEENTEESKSKLENINEALKAIGEFGDIKSFVEHSALVSENETLEDNFGGAVSLMTLHAAKGLEFDCVFLPGWEEGLFPHQRSINEEGAKGLEEERRIAYVGITRAKKELYISFAERRFTFREFTESQPSRFLAEIPDEFCVKLSSSAQRNVSFVAKKIYDISPGLEPDRKKTIKALHPTFGLGTILREEGDNLEILFEGDRSIKKIKRSFLSFV